MKPGNSQLENHSPPARKQRGLVGALGRIILGLLLAGMILWGVAAIAWSNLPAGVRPVAAGLFGAVSVGLLVFLRPRRRGLLAFLTAFVLVVSWWLRIPPSNSRDWQPDVATLASASIDGPRIIIHNIRNCDYRTESDYEVHHYDRTFDLDKLRTVDLYVIYWGSSAIAHTMLSFGFDGDKYVCISIETRMEKGEAYSAIKGFFKQYELIYVIGDERDLVRLRTNYREEDVYLYRVRAEPEIIREVFLNYLRRVNVLNERPEWYNALTQNCTTSIRGHTRPYAKRSRWNWKLLLNGYVDEFAYENGALDQRLPFAELKARSRVNGRARAADRNPAFSRLIREGLPGCR